MAAAMAAVPRLRVVASHMGGWRGWDEAQRCIIGKDCLLDTSMSLDSIPAQRAVAMIRQHGVAKTVWGTDSPWTDQKAELDRLASLGLTEDEFRQIAGGNAQSLLGLSE
jgi:predicted TIM-barrel fold metal-dependent hydrolase